MLQITVGPQLGNIVMIDHNVHVDLGPQEFEKQARRKLSDADTGTVIDLLIRHGLLVPLAESLQGFFDRADR